MSKTNGRTEFGGSRAEGTRAKRGMGRLPGFRGMLAGVLVGCVLWWGGAGVAQGQGMTKQIRVSPEFRTWYEQHKESEMSRRGRGAKEPIHEGEGSGYGLIPDLYDMSYLSRLNVGVVQTVGASYPQRYDLRDKGWVTDVKNQNPYGTCWAHATFGSLESHLKKSQGVEFDFSENNLVNLQEWDYSGWWGANAAAAEGYLLHWMGPVMEEDDRYYAVNGSERMAPAYHVQQVRWIPGKSSATDNDRIKEAVTQYGGLWVSYYHEDPYLSPNNAYYYTGNSNGNHAVTLVGWDDAYPKENFASEPPGDGAYIVKNSWGKRWGEDGYFYVSYYDILFARSTMYAFCNADSTNNYGKVYEYDPLGFVYESLWRSSTCKQWGANIFTATGDDTLAAIGFYALGPNTSYKISVYTGVSEGAPTSGTSAVSEQSGTLDTAGYFTIPLDKEVKVGKGKRFSVVVEVKTPGHTAPLGLEIALRDVVEKGSDYPTSEATAAKGQSFISFDGATWYDMFLNAEKYRPNFCCKVYTKSATAEKPKLTGVAIHALDGRSVESGKTGRFRCDATYSSGVAKEGVAATWSVVEGGEWGSIGKTTGVLQAAEVAEARTVTIRAVYTEDGVTKEAKGDVQITAGAPETPTGMTASTNDAFSVRVEWKAAKGATAYAVYRGETANPANAAHVYTASTCWYSDTDATPGVEYWYFVKAKNGDGTEVKASGYSAGAKGVRLLMAPMTLKVSSGLEGKIEVAWEASEGAKCYRVERSEGLGNNWQVVRGWSEERTFTDDTVECGYSYAYRVSVALDPTGRMAAQGLWGGEGRAKCPVFPDSLALTGLDSLKSGEEGEYQAFVVYSDGTTGKVAVAAAWTAGKATGNGTKFAVTAPSVTENTNITVTASASVTYTNSSGSGFVKTGGAKTVTVKAGVPGKVSGLRVTSATAAGVGLAWDAMAGAGGYAIARTGGSGGAVTFRAAGTEYTDAMAGPGVEYAYTVAAENAAGTGTASDPVQAFIGLVTPGGVTATSDREDCVRVKWGATAGATHFRVGWAASEGGAKTELGTWTTERSFDDTTGTAGVEYWYFVKAATGADGAHATGWSAGAKGMKKPVKTLTGLAVSGPDRVGSGERAVYACEAWWNDGEKRSVAAEWSAVGGEIGADGGFTAVETESDVAGRVVAAYGGMAATQEVTIVGAAVEAQATVTGAAAAQRWPFGGVVDIDYTLETAPAGTKAVVSVGAWDEDHGKALAARSLAGDGADGAPVEAGAHRVSWNLAADYPGLHAAGVRVEVGAVAGILAAPAGVTAEGATEGVMVAWSAVGGAESYEVWRGTVENDFDLSEKVADSTGLEWLDTSAEFDVDYYYWVRAVGSGGYPGTLSGCVQGRRVLIPTEIIIEGDDKVGADEYIQYKCLVRYGDFDEAYVTPTWSIVEGIGYATVYADGRVKTYSSSAGRSVVLKASYSQNGTEVSTTKTIQIVSPTFTIQNGVLTAVSLNGAKKVVIPSTVTSIGTNVFAESNLASVTIPNTVTNIGYKAFFSCTNLTTLSIPSSVEQIEADAFYCCTALESLTLRTGLKSIGASAFRGCFGLTELELPTGFSHLGEYAFSGCSGLTNLVIRGLERFDYAPFSSCLAIESVFLPASLKQYGCAGSFLVPLTRNLKRIDVDAGNEILSSENGVLYNKDKTVLYFVPRMTTFFTIPASVTTIHEWAFDGGLEALVQINVASANPVYSSVNGVVYNKDKTALVLVPKSIASISIPSTVSTIPASAFAGCTNLASLSIPDAVTVIPANMCSGCVALASISLPAGASSIGASSFANCTALRKVILPSGITVIGNGAFAGCVVLRDCALPSGVTVIGDNAFAGCTELENIALPTGLKTIGCGAFSGCPGIVHLSLRSGVESIGRQAFSSCPNLVDVFIPSSVTNIGQLAFHCCTNLTVLNVDVANDAYVSSGTCIVDKNTGDVIGWAGGASSVVVPEGAKVFRSGYVGYSHSCFAKAKSVTLPSTLKRIYKCGFLAWTELEQVVIPQGVETIDPRAFQYCPSLVAVTIPDTVTSFSIEYGIYGPFVECYALRSITMKGALDSYDGAPLFSTVNGVPTDTVIYVTSKWTGPTDTWCGRRVVVLDE